MNNSNLYKFAKSFSGLISSSESPQIIYEELLKLMRERKEYFLNLGPEKILKLIFLIYSYKNFEGFEEGEKMINNITFLKLIMNSEEIHHPECSSCDGTGGQDCDECDGRGTENCDDCDGEGTISCTGCDGTGEVAGEGGEMETCDECNGSGQVECDTCDGEGRTDCAYCNGGRNECEDCDGEGYLESDETIGYYSCVVTWNKFFSEKAKMTERKMEPLFDEMGIKMSEYFLRTKNEEVHTEFVSDMEEGQYFCAEENDSPNLQLSYDMRIMWGPDFYKVENDYIN